MIKTLHNWLAGRDLPLVFAILPQTQARPSARYLYTIFVDRQTFLLRLDFICHLRLPNFNRGALSENMPPARGVGANRAAPKCAALCVQSSSASALNQLGCVSSLAASAHSSQTALIHLLRTSIIACAPVSPACHAKFARYREAPDDAGFLSNIDPVSSPSSIS